jgi:succinate dehydrogenase / fumarate reductase membrane anchor subunit
MNPKFIGGTRRGLTEWLVQRLSAVYMAGFLLYCVLKICFTSVLDYEAWRAWWATGPVAVAWALFWASVLVHAWIGMRSVYLDYLKPAWVRFAVATATAFGLAALGVWAVAVVIRGGQL